MVPQFVDGIHLVADLKESDPSAKGRSLFDEIRHGLDQCLIECLLIVDGRPTQLARAVPACQVMASILKDGMPDFELTARSPVGRGAWGLYQEVP